MLEGGYEIFDRNSASFLTLGSSTLRPHWSFGIAGHFSLMRVVVQRFLRHRTPSVNALISLVLLQVTERGPASAADRRHARSDVAHDADQYQNRRDSLPSLNLRSGTQAKQGAVSVGARAKFGRSRRGRA